MTRSTTLAAVGIIAIGLTGGPSVHGQTRARELTVLEGRGGEIGVRISDAKSSGVEITHVQPDSAAARAGLKAGDIIVQFDGERVRSSRQFVRLVQETPLGRAVSATVTRDGKRQDVQLTTSEGRGSAMVIDGDFLRGRLNGLDQPDKLDQLEKLDRLRDLPFNLDFNFPMVTGGSRLGVTVTELPTQLADHLGAKGGVLVTSVTDGSPASRAGIQAGDVINSVNGSTVESRDDLAHSLRQSEGDEVTIGIVRDKRAVSLKAKIEAVRRTMRGRPA
jgi:serine protease Do